MGTHIFSGSNGEITQVADGWTFDPATLVKLERAHAYDLSGQLVARGETLRQRLDFRCDLTDRIWPLYRASATRANFFAFELAGNLIDVHDALVGRDSSSEARAHATCVTDACSVTMSVKSRKEISQK